jgi:Uma2 family endonuclease
MAAEGLERRRWTVAEIEAMVAAGIIEEDERIELIEGEVVPMSPKGIAHEQLKVALTIYWAQRLPAEIRFAQETTFRMSADTFVEPDFVFWRTADGLAKLRPETALLAVEVADSSLGFDLGRKARLYAKFAVPALWVIDAKRLVTHIFEGPGPDDYGRKTKVTPKKPLSPSFAPALAVRLGDLALP